MSAGSLTFPPDWPKDCPPAHAAHADGKVYACCRSNPPDAGDFRTAYERAYRPDADLCQRLGLSVSRTREDAEAIRQRFPRRNKFIAAAELTSRHGKLEPTKGPVSSHHTFWKYEQVSFHDIFRVLE